MIELSDNRSGQNLYTAALQVDLAEKARDTEEDENDAA